MKVDDFMNNKGFTLVELLAVIVILSLLALLASTSVTKMLKQSKEDIHDTQFIAIKSAAEIWGADNLDKLPLAGECKYLTLNDLKEYGIMDSSVKDSNTNKEVSDDLKIKITSKVGKKGNLVTSYEVDPEDITDCLPIYSEDAEI